MAIEATYYLESNALIDFIQLPEDDSKSVTLNSIIEDAEGGRFRIVTSVLTIAEVLWAKEEIDRQVIDPAVQTKIDMLFHPGSSPIELIPVHEIIARDAQKLLRGELIKGWAKTKGADAIHLITAQREKVDEFLTGEKAMGKWGPILGFTVCEPHYTPPSKPADNQGPGLFADQDEDSESVET